MIPHVLECEHTPNTCTPSVRNRHLQLYFDMFLPEASGCQVSYGMPAFSCTTRVKEVIVTLTLSVMCVMRQAEKNVCVCMHVCDLMGTCLFVCLFVLVRFVLESSLFGTLRQMSRTSSSSRRRCVSVMNLMY